ncbi:hypothetical protein ACFLXQ_08495, partial [Chloroflexota bacterium]
MLHLFSSILDWLQSLLGIVVDHPPKDDETTTAEKHPSIHVVRKLTKKAQTSIKGETPPQLGEFTKTYVIDRWQWMRSHPWTAALIVVIIGVAFYSERGESNPWWVDLIKNIQAWWVQTWQDYPVSAS